MPVRLLASVLWGQRKPRKTLLPSALCLLPLTPCAPNTNHSTFSIRRTPEADAVFISTDQNISRFANSNLHQNMSEVSAELTLRVIVDDAMGVASTTSFDADEIARTAALAREAAHHSHPLQNFSGLYRAKSRCRTSARSTTPPRPSRRPTKRARSGRCSIAVCQTASSSLARTGPAQSSVAVREHARRSSLLHDDGVRCHRHRHRRERLRLRHGRRSRERRRDRPRR